MPKSIPAIVIPTKRGRAALDELDRVPWHELVHAYATGVDDPRHDVRAALAQLAAADAIVVLDGLSALSSTIYHQGTIYEVTAPAVPFVAAFAAGPEVWIGHVRDAVCLIGSIAISSTFETTDGTMSGSYGDDVASATGAALRASTELLAAIAGLHPPFAELVEAIATLASADPPKRRHLDAVAHAVDVLEALELGDPPRVPIVTGADEWVAHPKFGVGLVVRREDDKVRVRFADGTERVLAGRFVTPCERPLGGEV